MPILRGYVGNVYTLYMMDPWTIHALRLIYQSECVEYSNAMGVFKLTYLSNRRHNLLHYDVDKCVNDKAIEFMFPSLYKAT